MKKNQNKQEGYFSFNTPTGSYGADAEKHDAAAQPSFNDFVCMPESEQAKTVEAAPQQSDPNYF